MKFVGKRITSLAIIIALMMSAMLTLAPIEVKAAGGVYVKITELKNTYRTRHLDCFTDDGKSCGNSACEHCRLSNILPHTILAGTSLTNGYSCVAFARYVFYYIYGIDSFGIPGGTNKRVKKITLAEARLGDFVDMPSAGHQGIFISQDSNYVYLYHSNWSHGGTYQRNTVLYEDGLSKTGYTYNIYRADNYDDVDNRANIQKPSAPTGLKAVKASDTSALVSWNPVSGATSYEAQYWREGLADFKDDYDYNTKTNTSYTSSGLLNFNTYKFRVRAINSAGVSPWSEYTYVKPTASVPSAPTGLKATKATDSSAIVSWNSVSGATSYQVQYWRQGMTDFKDDSDYTNKTATSYTSTGLANYNSYKYRVRAKNSAGTSPWSSEYTYVMPGPLSISKFSVKNASLTVGDKAVFTVETEKSAKLMKLYDQANRLVASTKSHTSKGSKRIWTISPVMAASGQFRYRAVAVNGSQVGNASAEVAVSVGTSSLGIKCFTMSSAALNVGETVTFMVTTGKLASRVSILDASNSTFTSSSKTSKTTSTQKDWTIKRKLTEGDMGSIALRAQVGSKYGNGPASAAQTLTVTDNLPRIIAVTLDKTTVKRGMEIAFLVVTNAAATSVWISNDKKEKWQQIEAESSLANRRTWRVTALPRQLGDRKFYVQAYRGTLPGAKVYVRKIRVIK